MTDPSGPNRAQSPGSSCATGSTGSPEMVTVSILEIPVQIWSRTQEHAEELLREFALIASQIRRGGEHRDIPLRLTQLVETLTAEFGGLNDDEEQVLAEAAEAGEEVVAELVFQVPPAAAPAARELATMLDEADAFCLDGRHLLAMVSPPDVVQFRNWYLDEFSRQIAGESPRSWPRYLEELGDS